MDARQIGFCGYEVEKRFDKEQLAVARKMGILQIKNCVIFPLKNKVGQIVSIYGRAVSRHPRIRHFYPSGPIEGVYPSYPKQETTQLILAESVIDAASIAQYQDLGVVALYGTNGFTKEHEEMIKELKMLEEVILFFDGDEGGKKAREAIKEKLLSLRANIKISYVDTPEGEDPNSLIQSHEPEILRHLIKNRLLFSTEKEHTIQGPVSGKGILETAHPELLVYQTAQLQITILGGIKITGLDRLKVTLKITKKGHLPLRHSLDLYHSHQLEQLVSKLAESWELGSRVAEETMSYLTTALEEYRAQKLELLKPQKAERPKMREAERKAALEYLQSPKLLRRTLQDIAASGIVGESSNGLIAYLAYTSKKREKPLHPMYLGSSGSGKPLSSNALYERIRSLARKAGIEKAVSLHSLRHSIATHLLQRGMKLTDIAQFLGHRSLSSIQIYTHLPDGLSL